jgi:hypothetical protein
MNEVIKLAIEKGGYKEKDYGIEVLVSVKSPYKHDGMTPSSSSHHAYRVGAGIMLKFLYPYFITSDPLFWRSLGKALGWNKLDKERIEQAQRDFGYSLIEDPTWLKQALRYQKLVLIGSSTERFWKDLLAPNK